jgi:hypothetical protein
MGVCDPLLISDWVPREDFHPDETDTLADFNRNKFLDLSKPLLLQVWRAPWTKEYYLSQVHNPRHLKESARLFEWDILEVSSCSALNHVLHANDQDPDIDQVVGSAHDLGTNCHIPIRTLRVPIHQPVSSLLTEILELSNNQ